MLASGNASKCRIAMLAETSSMCAVIATGSRGRQGVEEVTEEDHAHYVVGEVQDLRDGSSSSRHTLGRQRGERENTQAEHEELVGMRAAPELSEIARSARP
jgi:hypothetical protein